MMSMQPTIVCNNILKRSFSEEQEVSPMKLQKLMYFIACTYRKRTKTDLFSESFEVWKYGPVLRSVYDEFKSYGKGPILSYAKDAKGISYIIDESTSPGLKTSIDEIWSKFKDWDAIALSRITHEDGSGWSSAYDTHSSFITSDKMEADTTYEPYLATC